MIIYSVTITIDAEIESEWLDWMRRIHVPDVVRTGCFSECRIYKIIDNNLARPRDYEDPNVFAASAAIAKDFLRNVAKAD